MKAVWDYMCDFGHQWSVFRDYGAEEDPQDAVCPLGHEAVTLQRHPLLNPIEIRVMPAGQIADPTVKKQRILEVHCYITVVDLVTGRECRSAGPILWHTAQARIGRYLKMPFDHVCRDLGRMGDGGGIQGLTTSERTDQDEPGG